MLVASVNGSMYGTTYEGGANNLGTIFRLDPAGTVTVVHDFDGDTGANPYGRLLQGSDGHLYGATVSGGPAGAGVIFRLTLGTFVTLVPLAASGSFAGTTSL